MTHLDNAELMIFVLTWRRHPKLTFSFLVALQTNLNEEGYRTLKKATKAPYLPTRRRFFFPFFLQLSHRADRTVWRFVLRDVDHTAGAEKRIPPKTSDLSAPGALADFKWLPNSLSHKKGPSPGTSPKLRRKRPVFWRRPCDDPQRRPYAKEPAHELFFLLVRPPG